jgi:hypothetical protein
LVIVDVGGGGVDRGLNVGEFGHGLLDVGIEVGALLL